MEGQAAELLARLLWEQDQNQGEGFADFFTRDGVYHPANQDAVCGADAIKQYFKRRDAGLTRHVVTNVVVLRQSDDDAEIASIMTVYIGRGDGPHPAKAAAVLDCRDLLERIGGRWLIKHRGMRVVFRG
jgi:hypothetical protein